MIARMWHGRVPAAKAEAYYQYLLSTGLPDYLTLRSLVVMPDRLKLTVDRASPIRDSPKRLTYSYPEYVAVVKCVSGRRSGRIKA